MHVSCNNAVGFSNGLKHHDLLVYRHSPLEVCHTTSKWFSSHRHQLSSDQHLKPTPQTNAPAEKQVNLNVRVINPDKKKECEVYVLREITERVVSTPQRLIEELQRQFGPQLVPTAHHFPVGYMKGSTKVSIRSPADVADIWTHLNKGDQIVLWCEGVRRKTSHLAELSGSESDEEMSKKRKRSKKRKLSALDEKKTTELKT